MVYTGTILTDEGKEKKVNIDFEPFKPINTSLYLCDNKFHTEALNELLESDNKYVPAFFRHNAFCLHVPCQHLIKKLLRHSLCAMSACVGLAWLGLACVVQ